MMDMLLEHDEAVDAAYLTVIDARRDQQVRLDDARGISVGFRVIERTSAAVG
jgi:hypothetical protein